MERIVECVPNFSEGRDASVVARLVEAVESVQGALVLGTHVDPDHNRSVITFVAPPETIVEAAVRVVERASELIDLSRHAGQHPRMGACDVLPLIPVRGISVEECVALAHEAGERIWRELGVPVYFYESAALRPERTNLADVRRGGFELLREQIGSVPERAPDVGEARRRSAPAPDRLQHHSQDGRPLNRAPHRAHCARARRRPASPESARLRA
jgi:glutamate formiminotransferase